MGVWGEVGFVGKHVIEWGGNGIEHVVGAESEDSVDCSDDAHDACVLGADIVSFGVGGDHLDKRSVAIYMVVVSAGIILGDKNRHIFPFRSS